MRYVWIGLIIGSRLVVVLGLDHYLGSGDQLSILHDQLVHRTTPCEILRLDNNPADYLNPYIREAARRGASVCAQVAPFKKGSGRATIPIWT